MPPRLSDSTINEINGFFEELLTSKRYIFTEANSTLEMMLRSCKFVYVTDGGSVIHSRRSCGSAFNSMVPLDLAIKFGYTKPCKTCGRGSYVEKLLSEIDLL